MIRLIAASRLLPNTLCSVLQIQPGDVNSRCSVSRATCIVNHDILTKPSPDGTTFSGLNGEV